MWKLSEIDRWRLYRRWVYDAREKWHVNISELQELFDIKAAKLKRIKDEEDFRILSWADVIGMTTTGKYEGLTDILDMFLCLLSMPQLTG